jgi:hypothetical protein
MSRIRSIKPDFWSSEQVMALPRDARLLFIGLWNFADDAGRFRWSPRSIKAQVLPGDDVTAEEIERWLSLIVHCGLSERYVNDHGEHFGVITGWQHQKINRPQPPKYPDPKDCKPFSEWSVNGHCALTDHSPLIRRDPIGRERIGDSLKGHCALTESPSQGSGEREPERSVRSTRPDWTPERQQVVFRGDWLERYEVEPSMAGKHVAAFHRQVTATAERRGVDPEALFRDTLAEWLQKPRSAPERRAPYACFAQAFGELLTAAEAQQSGMPRAVFGDPTPW